MDYDIFKGRKKIDEIFKFLKHNYIKKMDESISLVGSVLASKLSTKEDKVLAYNYIAYIYFHKLDIDKSLIYSNKAYKLVKNSDNFTLILKVLELKYKIAIFQNNKPEIKTINKEILNQTFKNQKNGNSESIDFGHIMRLFSKGLVIQSLQLCFLSLENKNNSDVTSSIYALIAFAYYSVNDFKNSISYIKMSLELQNQTTETALICYLKNIEGDIYYLNKDYNEAEKSYKISFEIAKNKKYLTSVISVLISQIMLNIKIKKFNKAQKQIDKCYQLINPLEIAYLFFLINHLQAKSYYKQKKYTLAIQFAEKVKSEKVGYDLFIFYIDNIKVLYKSYGKVGKEKKSIKYLKKYLKNSNKHFKKINSILLYLNKSEKKEKKSF